MRLLDRYLLRELLVPFGYCLGSILIFWISSELFKDLGDFQKNQLRVGDIAEYYLVKTPDLLGYVLPLSLLLAVLYALTQHSRHQEITAMRAAGVSLWRIAAPYFGVGLIASLLLFAINEIWSPDSEDRAEAIKQRRKPVTSIGDPPYLIRNLGFNNTRDGRLWKIGGFNERTAEMFNVEVIGSLPDGSRRWLRAARAAQSNEVWVLYNVSEFHSLSPTNGTLVPGLRSEILPLPEFSETPEEIRSEIKISRRLNLKNRHRVSPPLVEIFNYLRLHPGASRTDQLWLYTQLHSRLAAPWKCLVVVLIALPFAAASGRRNVFVGVASSILIGFSYFLLLQIGLAAGTAGYLPAWLAGWFPNIFFTLTGLWLTARVR
jgi:lipopolysaccharide export system permease protein